MTLTERPAARVRGLREVHLLDLSRTGARIEHLDLFRLSASCTWGTLPSITSYRFRSPSHSARVSGPRATAWYTAWGLTPRGGREGSARVAEPRHPQGGDPGAGTLEGGPAAPPVSASGASPSWRQTHVSTVARATHGARAGAAASSLKMARRSRPHTLTWCRGSGASRRGWRGMASVSLTPLGALGQSRVPSAQRQCRHYGKAEEASRTPHRCLMVSIRSWIGTHGTFGRSTGTVPRTSTFQRPSTPPGDSNPRHSRNQGLRRGCVINSR